MGNNPYCYRGEIRNFVDDQQFTYLFADLTPAYRAQSAIRMPVFPLAETIHVRDLRLGDGHQG